MIGAPTVDSREKSLLAAKAALDKKASDLVVFEVGGLTSIADYFIICSAESQRQVRAIRDHIEDTLSQQGCHPFSTEGEETSRWILMDYSDLIIHIFKEEVRVFYALERLWGDAPRLDVGEAPRSGASVRTKKLASVRLGRRKQEGAGGL